MDVIKALQWRYATKSFDKDKLVSQKKLTRLMDAFNLSASSYGLQPIKLVVVSDKELQKELCAYSMNQKQIEQASHVLVLCIEKTISKNYIKDYFSLVKSVRKTPDEILKPFKNFLISHFEGKSQKEIDQWAINQAYLALGTLLTVCAVEGIDACPMEGFEPAEYDELLDIKSEGLQSVLVLPIGYRAEDDFMANLKKVRKNRFESVIIK